MKSAQKISFYSYWGKADQENNFHLLPYHCLDVAAVADCYLDLHPHLLDCMSMALGFTPEESKSLILFFVALHDLGKFSVCFQSKVSEIFKILLPGSKDRSNTNRHDVLGQVLWEKKLVELFIKNHVIYNDYDEFQESFNILMRAVTGHHGEPPFIENPDKCIRAFDEDNIEAAKKFYFEIAKLFLGDKRFDLRNHEKEVDFEICNNRLSWWLSGLTILSDWLGSNTYYFKYKKNEVPLESYWNETKKIAKKAIDESGLNKIDIKKDQNFKTIFAKDKLRPLQKLADEIPLYDQGQLFILEDVTGSGKTEAALLLAYRMMQKNLADGIYFGLPTMATANGMYDRLKNAYQNFFNKPEAVSLILAHANNKLSKPFHDSIGTNFPEDKALVDELDTATAFCNAWLADNRKKALLANVGVGTIDQALQSILPNKHQSLRLLGLFHKILIVDEVHACDTYMQVLLENLLKFHGASGGSAILLSATLTIEMRQKLVDAFFEGRGFMKRPLKKNNYPLLTHAYAGEIEEEPIEALPELKREVEIHLSDNESEVEKYILEQLTQGRCVCWIRNTVYDAVTSFEKFQAILPSEKIMLFHARFTMQDRYNIEDKVKKLFGKDSTEEDRKGRLLIATQVVEQSLDLDFDCMITDLAPIDLIIQRAGRLQRHQRLEQRTAPILWIYGPLPIQDIQQTWYGSFFDKGQYVYPDHARLWLSAKLLSDKGKLIMPDDARDLIDGVYTKDKLPVPECFSSKTDKNDGKKFAAHDLADRNRCKLDFGYRKNRNDSWWGDERTPTRLNNKDSITVYLARQENEKIFPWCSDNSRFVWQMNSLSVALYHFDGLSEISNSPIQVSSILEQLPDKGKYSVLLIYNPLTNDGIVVRDKKLLRLGQFHYSSEKGLRIDK